MSVEFVKWVADFWVTGNACLAKLRARHMYVSLTGSAGVSTSRCEPYPAAPESKHAQLRKMLKEISADEKPYDSLLGRVSFESFMVGLQRAKSRVEPHKPPESFLLDWLATRLDGPLQDALADYLRNLQPSEKTFDAACKFLRKYCGTLDLNRARLALFAKSEWKQRSNERLVDFARRVQEAVLPLADKGLDEDAVTKLKWLLITRGMSSERLSEHLCHIALMAGTPDRLVEYLEKADKLLQSENPDSVATSASQDRQRNPQNASGDRRAPASNTGNFSGGQVGVCNFFRQGKECPHYRSGYCRYLHRNEQASSSGQAGAPQASLKMMGADTVRGSFGSFYEATAMLAEEFAIGDGSLERARTVKRFQLDPGADLSHVRIDFAKQLVSQGHAEWDVDKQIVLQYSDGSKVPVSDAIVVRMERVKTGGVYHIRFSVLKSLSADLLLGRSGLLQIGRADLLDESDREEAGAKA
jgi:hypothetical protein